MYTDYHVHSEFSDDSDYIMEDIIKDAIALGIEELCFTDHVDYGIKRDWDDPRGVIYRNGGVGEPEHMPVANVDYPRYAKKIAKIQDQYRKKIRIKFGMEFGMQSQTIPEYEELFKKYPFDFIILSVHQIGNKEFWTGDFGKGLTQKDLYMTYYNELLTLVENYHNYSVLGHMDLIARYDSKGDFPFSEAEQVIGQILKKVIADGKGIEVNTSSFRYGLKMTPGKEILQLYRSLGGEILTIGSDSHKKEHLGYHIPETLKELKKMEFEKICTFEQMKPVFHTL